LGSVYWVVYLGSVYLDPKEYISQRNKKPEGYTVVSPQSEHPNSDQFLKASGFRGDGRGVIQKDRCPYTEHPNSEQFLKASGFRGDGRGVIQ
jgi:hypothetical protein